MSERAATDADQKHWEEVFYQNLQALARATFPKHCSTCGKAFQTPEHFLRDTAPVYSFESEQKSGLFSLDPQRDCGVGVFRNCTCGNTLMVDFQTRRDNSPEGHQRRAQFEKLLDMLQAKGLTNSEARTVLLDIFNGRRSAHTAATLTDGA